MKSKLKNALNARDKDAAREIIITMLDTHPGSLETIESLTGAVGSFPEMFVDDDGTIAAIQPEEYSPELIEELRERLRENFSREKLSLFVDMSVSLDGTEPEAARETRVKREAKEKRQQEKTGKAVDATLRK